MPQPLRRYKSLTMQPEALFKRPKLAAHIAFITARWSQIDIKLGHLFGNILGAHAEIGMAVYLALRGDGPRMDALKAAAEARLSKAANTRLSELLVQVRELARLRNDLVHGAWGTTPAYKDALILADPRDHLKAMATFTANMAKLTAGDLTMMDKNMFPKIGPADIGYWVYKERDFLDIEKRLAALEIEIGRFTTGAMMAPDLGAQLIAPS